MRKIGLVFILMVFLVFEVSGAKKRTTGGGVVPEGFEKETVTIADFESLPNNLGGDVGVYGDGEPNWANPKNPHCWYYESASVGYDKKNVYKGTQSFRLINGEKGLSNGWASFNMNLGPTLDKKSTPIKVQPLNVSSYNKLIFYIKGQESGENFSVIFRDSHATDYLPQVKVEPLDNGCTTDWVKVEILLSRVAWKIDLKELVNIGLEFGVNVGNRQGATMYLDNFMFVK